MSKETCYDCLRFERPKDPDTLGWCTQCGEDTNAKTPKCHWFTPRRKKHGEEEKD